jgi:hypothetical protein
LSHFGRLLCKKSTTVNKLNLQTMHFFLIWSPTYYIPSRLHLSCNDNHLVCEPIHCFLQDQKVNYHVDNLTLSCDSHNITPHFPTIQFSIVILSIARSERHIYVCGNLQHNNTKKCLLFLSYDQLYGPNGRTKFIIS